MAWHQEKATKVNELVVRERHNRHRRRRRVVVVSSSCRRRRRRRRRVTSTASILLERLAFTKVVADPLSGRSKKNFSSPSRSFGRVDPSSETFNPHQQ